MKSVSFVCVFCLGNSAMPISIHGGLRPLLKSTNPSTCPPIYRQGILQKGGKYYMAKITVNKKTNYTTIDNNIFKNKNLSLKARGLLTTMLSLPSEWDYTVNGLCTILKDGKSSIQSAMRELEENGYLVRVQTKDKSGKFSSADYTLYEIPLDEKPLTENPSTDKPSAGNPSQLNNNKLNRNKEITKEENTNINAFNSKELKDESINAFCPGQKDREEKIPYINLNVCTQQELHQHILRRAEKFLEKHGENNTETVDELTKTIEYFYQKYQDTFGESYTILSDKAFEGIVVKFLYPSELLGKNEINCYEYYKKMIDRYFQTDFGKNSGYAHVELSLPHFMSDTIRENMAMNSIPMDALGCAWSI